MRKLLILFICLCMLPVFVAAEDGQDIPEGYRMEDFGDFTMPIAPNAIVRRHDPDKEDGFVAEVLYMDLSCEHFAPYIIIWRHPNNMSAYLQRAHPLDYAKSLRDNVVAGWREAGMVITSPEAVYGQKKGGTLTCMISCRIEENSWFCNEAHDLWMVQRYFGTYDMGTCYFEIYAESRADADALLRDIDRVVYR